MVQLSTTQLIAATTAGLFVSSDSGASWTQTRVGGGGQYYVDVAAVPSMPGRVFATFEGGVLLTTDFGATWSTLGTASIGRIANIAVDAQTPTRMVITGGYGAAYSTDGGLTWTDATQSPIASSPSELVTTVANNSKVYTYVDSAGLFSTSGDSGWQRLNLDAAAASAGPFNKPRIAVRPGALNAVYITPQGNWPVHSEDGGNTWSSPTTSSMNMDPAALAFDKDNTNIIYAAMKRRAALPMASVYRSLDGGVNWAPYSNDIFIVEGRDLQIDPVDGSRMFIAGSVDWLQQGGVWRSVDRGVTWARVGLNGVDVRNVAINPATPARVYASTRSGLYVTSDGGDSFAANASFGVTTGNRAATSVQIDPTVPSTVYAISEAPATASGQGLVSSSHVLRSVDDGQTWEVLRDATATPRWAVTDLAVDPNEPSLIYVTTGGRDVGRLRIAPDLAVEISGHSGTRPRNEPATFNLRAVNNGPYSATVVRLITNLPAGLTNVSATTDRGNCTAAAAITCDTAVLRVGEAMNVVVHYTPPTVMAVPVTASVTAHESDVAAANNSVEANAHTEGDFADLRVTLQPSATSATRGGNVTYSITVTNGGPVTANAGTLTLPRQPADPADPIDVPTTAAKCCRQGGLILRPAPRIVSYERSMSARARLSKYIPILPWDRLRSTAPSSPTGRKRVRILTTQACGPAAMTRISPSYSVHGSGPLSVME